MTNSNNPLDDYVPTIDDITFVQSKHCPCLTNNLSVDEGINYGLSFFETILILDKPIFLTEHINRLNNSLRQFNIRTHISEDLIYKVVALCNINNKGLKILVSASNIIVSVRPLTYTKDYYNKGAKVMLSPIIRSSHSYLINHKSANYGDLILSLRNAHELGYNDCLFFNEHGFLTESAIANLFIIKNNQLLTPSLNQGLLPGIVRQYVINSYPVIETSLSIDDLIYADAVFLTNSLVGIIRVSHIDFDKTIIKQNPQLKDPIVEVVNYEPHPLINQLKTNYSNKIKE